jgi:hypothetical protein
MTKKQLDPHRLAQPRLPQSPVFRRRQFLQAAGLGGASLFLPSLERRSHAGPNDGPPLRLVVFFHEHGVYYDNWKMRLPSSPDSEQLDFEFSLAGLGQDEFSPILAPLHQHRADMLVLDGLAYLTAMSDPYGETRYHHNAPEDQNTTQLAIDYAIRRRWSLEGFFGDAAIGAIGIYWTRTFPPAAWSSDLELPSLLVGH